MRSLPKVLVKEAQVKALFPLAARGPRNADALRLAKSYSEIKIASCLAGCYWPFALTLFELRVGRSQLFQKPGRSRNCERLYVRPFAGIKIENTLPLFPDLVLLRIFSLP